jgi:hypothetical protein
MPTAKVTLHFSEGAAGWHEIYYVAVSTNNPDDANGGTTAVPGTGDARKLAQERARLLSERSQAEGLARITGMTISTMPAHRQAAYFPLDYGGPKGQAAGPSGQRTIKIALWTANNANRRILTLRGLPTSWLDFDLDANFSGQYANGAAEKAIKRFMDFLAPDPLGGAKNFVTVLLHTQTWLPAPGGSKIVGATVDVNGYWVLTVPLTTVGTFAKVKVRGMRGPSLYGINGPAIVLGSANGAVTINKAPCRECGPAIRSYGTLSVVGDPNAYVPITRARFLGYSDRKTGHVSDVASARAKSCVCG